MLSNVYSLYIYSSVFFFCKGLSNDDVGAAKDILFLEIRCPRELTFKTGYLSCVGGLATTVEQLGRVGRSAYS